MGLKDLRIEAAERAKLRIIRQKEKERRNRRTHKYGQAERKHARRGVVSCSLAFVSAFLWMLIFAVSYSRHGDVNLLIGLAGFIALGVSIAGLIRGIEGFKERNKKYETCKVGIACNLVLILSFVITYIRGYF